MSLLPNNAMFSYDHLKRLLDRAILSLRFFFNTYNMANEELLETVQRELVAARDLQTTIIRHAATLDSQLTRIDGLVQQLVDREEGCPICRESTTNPTTTTCGHVFCRRCITTWLTPADHTTCPTCRMPVSIDGLRAVEQTPVPALALNETPATTTNSSEVVAQRQAQTFASFYQQRSTTAAHSQRRRHRQLSPSEQAAFTRELRAYLPRSNNTTTTSRAARATTFLHNGSGTSTVPNGRTRTLLEVLRSVPRSGPVPAQQEEIQAMFERAERNYTRVRDGNRDASVRGEAARKWEEIAGARRRITRCSTAEQEKIARYVERLEALARG